MEINKPTVWQNVKAILFVIVITGLITALYYYLIEPMNSRGSGGFIAFSYETRQNFAFILGLILGGIFGLFLAPPLVLIRTRSFLLLTLYGLLAGLVVFIFAYQYQLRYIHSTWTDAHMIKEQTNLAFYAVLPAILVGTAIGMLTSFAKRMTMKF